ncbi:hypothetical protein [Maricaulis sp.]|uniref:hypothetical protein n=1 Tax=Maricaulis sp. TaxID=1486257 RepID=UPI0026359A80|nr:hypothetical protein [Maricaulis sp.]MDF1769737.1 hypothetical protein [Maricaulis sp.]
MIQLNPVVHSALAAITLAALSAPAHGQVPSMTGPVSFHYDDLSRFETLLEDINNGADPPEAFTVYMANASTGFRGWMDRYNVSAENFGTLYEDYGAVFHALPDLTAPLLAKEDTTRDNIERLRALAGSDIAIPVYYFVSSQHRFAGTPVRLANDPAGVGVGAALGVAGRYRLEDGPPATDRMVDSLTYLAVHEGSHILQLHAQGGLENYRSIYAPGGGTMLSIALREGCAEYLSFLTSGERYGDRHLYVAEHEAELWSDFLTIAAEPAFSVPGWFSGSDSEHPDRPFQIGYAVGSEMCRAYHEEMPAPDAGVSELFSLYDAEQAEAVAAAYSRAVAARTR